MGEYEKSTNYSSRVKEKKKIIILIFLLIITIAGIITCSYYIYSEIKLNKKYDTQAYAQWVVVVSDNINDSVKWHFEDLNTERIDKNTIKAIGNIIGEKENIEKIPLEFKKIANGEVELIENDDYKTFKEKIQDFIRNNSTQSDEEKIKKIKIDYRNINRAFLGDDSLVMPDSEVTEITPDGDNDSAYIVKSSMIIPKQGLGQPKFYPIKMKIQYKNGEYNFQYLDDEIEDNDTDDSDEVTNNNPTEEVSNNDDDSNLTIREKRLKYNVVYDSSKSDLYNDYCYEIEGLEGNASYIESQQDFDGASKLFKDYDDLIVRLMNDLKKQYPQDAYNKMLTEDEIFRANLKQYDNFDFNDGTFKKKVQWYDKQAGVLIERIK